MAGEQTPQRRHDDAASGANLGWAAVSYLIAGMAFWGFTGWLIDRWLHTGGIATAIGCVVGMAGGIYLVVRKLGA
jgi:F0F1-type ATP synthase assembly protein I